MNITEFLLARIDDDENMARCAGHGCGYLHEHNAGWVEIDLPAEHNARPSYEMWFIKTMNPDRVLAECESKRQIIEEHGDGRSPTAIYSEPYCRTCSDDTVVTLPCRTLKALAQPYADHADFDPKWTA